MDTSGQLAEFGVVFRPREQQTVLKWRRDGHSCSLVGLSNSGKSRLLRSLATPKIRQQLTPANATPVVVALVDCQMAAEDEAAFYELALRQVIAAAQQGNIAASTLGVLKTAQAEMLHGASSVAFRSLFSESLRSLLQESNLRLIILLDELDDAWVGMPPWPFRILRALRDDLPARLAYIAATSRRLERLRPDASVYEFREMFHNHTLVLQPLSQEESEYCFDELHQHWNCTLPDVAACKNLTLALAGGHPGLIKRIYFALAETKISGDLPLAIWATRLLALEPIRQECLRLWEELEIDEREGLLALVAGGVDALDDLKRKALEARGILTYRQNEVMMFSQVFAAFVRGQLNQARRMENKGVLYEAESGRVWVDGREITLELSDQQRKLLRLFYQRAGKVCTFQEIEEAVWGAGQGIYPKMIHETVKRLRQKIEPDALDPTYIVNVRGEGYMLQPNG